MSPSQSRHSNVCALQVCSVFQRGLAALRHADTSWTHRTPEGGLVEAREFSSCVFAGAEISLSIRPWKSVAPSHPFRDKTCEMDGARCAEISSRAMDRKRHTARSSREAGRLFAPVSGRAGDVEIKTA